ncbi:hypothetical protein [Falsiroseomonas sp. HW251]|uniref:hypothetical protein n=1 Tax=Falsiroseomonas sp. HW251 TaxID=3390998 RepID=UPI003D313D93
MADPIPEPVFDALMARAGITLDPEGRASVLGASSLFMALIERLHTPGSVAVEPAPVFAPRRDGK